MTDEVRKTRIYLNQIKEANAQIKATQDRIKEIHKAQTYLSGISYDKPVVQTSSSGDPPYVNAVICSIDMQKQLQARLEKLTGNYQRIAFQIIAMEDGTASRLLSDRFLKGLEFWQIADKMGYSEGYIRQLMTSAYTAFYQQYKEDCDSYRKAG